MDENSNNNGWSEWSRHVLAEIVRLNDEFKSNCNLNKEQLDGITSKIDKLSCDIQAMNAMLVRHDEFISMVKSEDVIAETRLNSQFRKNTQTLVWKIVGAGLATSGAGTVLFNLLSKAFGG